MEIANIYLKEGKSYAVKLTHMEEEIRFTSEGPISTSDEKLIRFCKSRPQFNVDVRTVKTAEEQEAEAESAETERSKPSNLVKPKSPLPR